jgi:hypothetical protein
MIAMKADNQLKISPDLKIKFSGSFYGLPFPSKVYHFPQIQKSRDLAVNCSTSDLCFSLRDKITLLLRFPHGFCAISFGQIDYLRFHFKINSCSFGLPGILPKSIYL